MSKKTNKKSELFHFKVNPFLGTNEVLDEYEEHLQERSEKHMGMPYNLKLKHEELSPFLEFSINNLGDPFVQSNYGVHSRAFEVQVLQYFAHLWKIPLKKYWGYVTMCGSEGNLYAMILGREIFPDAILYTSEESHLSIFKASLLFKIPLQTIKTLENGELDYDDFEKKLSANKDKPAIINLNIGTTVTGSVDNVDNVLNILEKYNFKNRYYLHCDGDLLSMLLNQVDDRIVIPSFEKDIHSISISGHKFLGCPMPCGVLLTYNHLVKHLEQHIQYLNSVDTTITGSRNGQAALSIWYTLREKGRKVFIKEVSQCLENAEYLSKKLSDIKIDSNVSNNIVMFSTPKNPHFIKKWQLLTHKKQAVVSIMPNITKQRIDEFVNDLLELETLLQSKL
eukprot:gene7337-11656_t